MVWPRHTARRKQGFLQFCQVVDKLRHVLSFRRPRPVKTLAKTTPYECLIDLQHVIMRRNGREWKHIQSIIMTSKEFCPRSLLSINVYSPKRDFLEGFDWPTVGSPQTPDWLFQPFVVWEKIGASSRRLVFQRENNRDAVVSEDWPMCRVRLVTRAVRASCYCTLAEAGIDSIPTKTILPLPTGEASVWNCWPSIVVYFQLGHQGPNGPSTKILFASPKEWILLLPESRPDHSSRFRSWLPWYQEEIEWGDSAIVLLY